MSKIKLTVEDAIIKGKQVSFKAPCSSADATGLIINDIEYDMVDAIGNSMLGIGGAWACDAMVSVILNTNTNKAYIQNPGVSLSVEDITDKFFSDSIGLPINGTTIYKHGNTIYGHVVYNHTEGSIPVGISILDIAEEYIPKYMYTTYTIVGGDVIAVYMTRLGSVRVQKQIDDFSISFDFSYFI